MLFGCSSAFLPVDSLGECDTFCVSHPLLNFKVPYSPSESRRVLHTPAEWTLNLSRLGLNLLPLQFIFKL